LLTGFALQAMLAYAGASETLKGKLTLTGSSTIAPLAAELGTKFEALHPGTRVDVQTGGSSRGIADARQGLADIGMVSRALKPEEKDLLPFTIAKDGITIILHKSNRVAALNDSQIVGIYKGGITNWKQVGGKDAPITVVSKAEGRSTLELFLHYTKLKPEEIKAHVIVGDNEQGIRTVSGNPNSIGYVSIGTAEYDASQGVAIKLLPVQGVTASIANVENSSFPISRPLNLVVRAAPQGLAKAFIEFAESKDMDPIVKDQYFVPFHSK
jgi:phosphate transport system substrate-binding protein